MGIPFFIKNQNKPKWISKKIRIFFANKQRIKKKGKKLQLK